MKTKKLIAKLAVMPFGIAAALTAPGSATYYGNASTNGTAAINPYVFFSLLVFAPILPHLPTSPSFPPLVSHIEAKAPSPTIPDTHLAQTPKSGRRPVNRKTLRRIQQSIKRSLSFGYITMSYSTNGNPKDPRPGRAFSLSWLRSSNGRTSHRKRGSTAQTGSLAEPGRVLRKEEREQRIKRDASPKAETSPTAQKAEDYSFQAFWQKIKFSERAQNFVDGPYASSAAPEIAASTVEGLEAGTQTHVARRFIVLLIAFLIVFGALYSLFTHLLNSTRASAQCTTSTVSSTVTIPVPVTYTFTESIFVSPTACTTAASDIAAAVIASASPSTITHTSTSTTKFFKTTTLTDFSAFPSESSFSTSSTLPFVFSVNSGSTSCMNGVSPSSGASLNTATTTISVTASDPVSPLKTSTTTSQTTRTHTTTVTPPAETSIPSSTGTSTSTSISTVDVRSTIRTTRTSTIPMLTTTTRSSFGGVGSSGWNLTSSQTLPSASTVSAATLRATPTTATISFFWASSGGHTYSTSTKIMTTTLYRSVPFDVSGLIPAGLATSKSSIASNGTASLLGSPSSTTIGGAGTSAFPTMSPGTEGISPASGSAAAISGDVSAPSQTTFLSTGTGVHDTTGVPTGATSAFPSNNSTLSTASSQSDFEPASVSGAETLSSCPASSPPATSSSSTSPSNGNGTSGLSSPSTSPASASTASSSTAIQSSSTGSLSASVFSTGTAVTDLSSVTPSTQALSSVGSSLANGPAVPTSFTLSSATSSTQYSLANGQASDPSSTASSFSGTSISTDSTSSEGTTSGSSSTTSSSATATVTGSVSSGSTTSTSSQTSGSATASPTACGEHGDFVLDFDDLPSFSGDEDITQAPPIFSPYHHLTFSNGYVYVPRSKQAIPPHSGEQLAVFLVNGNGTNDTTWHQNGMTANVARTELGEITDGPYDGLPAFWFNAQGAWLGCDNDGPEPCIFNVTGWTWDAQLGDEVATYNTQIELPPCTEPEHCQIQHVDFPDNFRGLSGIQIQAIANGEPRMFFMDDLALAWFDDSCSAGMQRMGRAGRGGPGRSGGGRKRVVRRSLMR